MLWAVAIERKCLQIRKPLCESKIQIHCNTKETDPGLL